MLWIIVLVWWVALFGIIVLVVLGGSLCFSVLKG